MGDERLELFAKSANNSLRQSIPLLVSKPPLAQCEVCVIVPVRNEAQTLEATLKALTYQIDLKGKKLDWQCYEVILLANNCNDNSAEVARCFARLHPELVLHVIELTLSPAEAYIGRVRQILMDEAYRRLIYLGRKQGIIASTDGDSQVTPTWIAANIAEIAAGADAVGGWKNLYNQERSRYFRSLRQSLLFARGGVSIANCPIRRLYRSRGKRSLSAPLSTLWSQPCCNCPDVQTSRRLTRRPNTGRCGFLLGSIAGKGAFSS
jgi:glycosyltransferase involved in cell wall biosynthesis